MTAPLFFKVRYTRGGAWCGLKVWHGLPADPDTGEPLDRSPRWQCEFNGKLSHEPDRWLLHFEPDGTPVIAGETITESEYAYFAELHSWAAKYAPNDPAANPRQAIDLLTVPIPF